MEKQHLRLQVCHDRVEVTGAQRLMLTSPCSYSNRRRDRRFVIQSGGRPLSPIFPGAVIIGDVQKVPRTTGFFQVIAVAFNLLSSWLTVASTLILGLSHGGSVAVLYGLVVILIMYGAVALSLAEMAARYTTAGGQYHWTALLAPDKMKRGLVIFPKACSITS